MHGSVLLSYILLLAIIVRVFYHKVLVMNIRNRSCYGDDRDMDPDVMTSHPVSCFVGLT